MDAIAQTFVVAIMALGVGVAILGLLGLLLGGQSVEPTDDWDGDHEDRRNGDIR